MTEKQVFIAWAQMMGHDLTEGEDGKFIDYKTKFLFSGWLARADIQEAVERKEIMDTFSLIEPTLKSNSAAPQTSTTPQIDNDVWIELGDAAIPVHPDSVVEVKMRNGATDGPREAGRFFWYRGNEVRDEMGCDIIAYRVIENDGREG